MVLPQHSIERRTFMGTTILSFSDRVVIETLHNEKRSLQYIADYLGFSKTTIFNELHRLDVTYQAQLAQADFEKKVTQRGRKSSLTTNLKRLIEELSDDELVQINWYLNSRPLKCLNWHSPIEIFLLNLRH